MRLIAWTRAGIERALTETIVCYLIVRHPAVKWYAKSIVLIPVAYILSPIDLIPDALVFLGQVDDLFVIRISYSLMKKLIPAEVLEECRARAVGVLAEGRGRRMRYVLVLSAIWITLVTLGALYLVRRLSRHR